MQRTVPREARARVFEDFIDRIAAFNGEIGIAHRYSPWYSFNSGRAGIAYVLFRLYELGYGTEMLAVAERTIDDTLEQIDTLTVPEDIDLASNPTSLFHSESGVWYVRSLIKSAAASSEARASIDGFIQACLPANPSPDLTLGRAGVALGALSLLKRCRSVDAAQAAALKDIVRDVAVTLRSLLAQARLQRSFLGAAHGIAGLAFTLLRSEKDGCADERFDHSWLQPLVESVISGESGARWPRTMADPAEEWAWPSWCNGSAGMVHTLLLGADMLGRPDLLELARAAGYFVGRTPGEVYSLCCGIAGGAYALFALHEATGEAVWHRRGLEFAELAAVKVLERGLPAEGSFGGHALFTGAGAVVLLHAELERGVTPAMPVLY